MSQNDVKNYLERQEPVVKHYHNETTVIDASIIPRQTKPSQHTERLNLDTNSDTSNKSHVTTRLTQEGITISTQ